MTEEAIEVSVLDCWFLSKLLFGSLFFHSISLTCPFFSVLVNRGGGGGV